MKKFVVVGGNSPYAHGTIVVQRGIQEDLVAAQFSPPDSQDFAIIRWQDLRELDDSPIAAGDEAVCVDASDIDGVEAGKSYRVTTVKGDLIAFSGNYRAMNKDRFVKVKPIAPEVKQEATTEKYFVLLHADHEWVARDNRTDAMLYAQQCAKGGARCIVYKPVSIAEPAEPVVTTLD